MVGKIRLLVAMEDDVYLEKLCDYLECTHGHFVIERFSNRGKLLEKLRKQLEESEKPLEESEKPLVVDAALFESSMLSSEKLDPLKCIKIAFGNEDSFVKTNDTYTIRAYQKLEAIAAGILRICSEDERFIGLVPKAGAGASTRFYLFASPAGGVGKTTVSLASAMHMSHFFNRKTLYVNLESVSCLLQLLPQAQGMSMTQFMRMIIEKNARLYTALEGSKAIHPDTGLCYLSPFKDITDFAALTGEHMRRMAEELQKVGAYDAVVIDCDWNAEIVGALMEISHSVLLPTRNTNLSVEKLNVYLNQISRGAFSYRNRVSVVLNAANGAPNNALVMQPRHIIPHYPMVVDAADFTEVVLNSNPFHTAIRRMTAELLG